MESLRAYELVLLLDPKLSESEHQEIINRIETLLGDSIKLKDARGTTSLAYPLNDDAQRVSASVICFFLHLNPARVVEIKKEFVFMKSIMRYGFFVRSNTEAYLTKKELMTQVATMLEGYSEKTGKQKHFLKLSESQSYLIDRKNEALLKLFITRFGQIKPRKYTGLAVRLQKKMREQIMRGRELGVVEFTK